jgi:hypothetical protein
VITPSAYEPASIYTGTSVSTAVVSSIAAVIWQLRPELGPDEVMQLIDQSGEELPSLADYHGWRLPAPHLRRLSLCAAVRQACEGGLCGVPDCALPKQAAADLSPLAKGVTKNPNAPALVPAALPPGCALASTPVPRFFVSSSSTLLNGDGGSACPLYLLPDKLSQQWVASQPDDPPCPGCTFAPPPRAAAEAPVDPGDYVLAIEVTPEWQATGAAGAIKSAALDVDCYSNGRFTGRTTYAIPQHELDQALAPAGPHRFRKGFGFGASLEGCTASLNFKVTMNGKTYSVQNPVYVDP